jgi:hypothetical protein
MTSPSSTVRHTAKPPDRPGRVEARDPSRRYEQAVPLAPMDELTALVDREAPWQEMLDLVNAAAQSHSLI